MKSIIVIAIAIVVGIIISWHYTDISSSAVSASIVAPLAVFLLLVSLLVLFVLTFENKGINQNASSDALDLDEVAGDASDCLNDS